MSKAFCFVSVLFMMCSCAAASSQTTQFYDYLTPQMFGAKGDGKHDDTEAFRKALYESDRQSKTVFIPSGSNYLIKGTLNYYNGKYQSYTLNLLGSLPIKKESYSVGEYGGITVANGVSLFKSARIKGSIDRICFIGRRDESVHFFDHCTCVGLVINGCNIANFGSVFQDTEVRSVSQITHNTFLTVFYFARNTDSSAGVVDSDISFNYINGGAEMNNNACFEWSYYNGSTISNNFVDYYRIIYYPKAINKQAFVGPNSYANQYQVFRYFYAAGPNIQNVTFSSVSDSFNWNDPETLDKLKSFEPMKYRGKDGKEYEIPPYVAICKSPWEISISNAKIEGNMRSLVFIASSLTEYRQNRFDVSFIGNNQYKSGQISFLQGTEKPFYNDGKFLDNSICVSGIIETAEKLPSLNRGWSASYNGRTVSVGGKKYRATNKKVGTQWKAEWEEIR